MSVPSWGEGPGPPPGSRRRAPLRAGGSTRVGPPATSARATGAEAAVDIEPDAEGAPAASRTDALATLHRDHYPALVRLATLVVGDVGVAEQVTQDAFVKLQLRWGGLRRLDKAPAYLRSAVLNAARSHLRRRKVSERHDARRTVAPSVATPEAAAMGRADEERMLAALRRLPARQREAVTLRYYLDLPEGEIAAAMGVSAGSVKTHLHRGLSSLARLLGERST